VTANLTSFLPVDTVNQGTSQHWYEPCESSSCSGNGQGCCFVRLCRESEINKSKAQTFMSMCPIHEASAYIGCECESLSLEFGCQRVFGLRVKT
jgi:hypothetical protein